MGRRIKYATEEERRAAERERRARYKRSEKGKAAERRYHQGEAFKSTLRKYIESPKGIATRAKNRKHYVRYVMCGYVQDGRFDLIEGWDMVQAHPELKWDVHHRLENEGFSTIQLIEAGMYYNRPPYELVWMTHSAHITLHRALRRKNKLVNT